MTTITRGQFEGVKFKKGRQSPVRNWVGALAIGIPTLVPTEISQGRPVRSVKQSIYNAASDAGFRISIKVIGEGLYVMRKDVPLPAPIAVSSFFSSKAQTGRVNKIREWVAALPMLQPVTIPHSLTTAKSVRHALTSEARKVGIVVKVVEQNGMHYALRIPHKDWAPERSS